MKPPETNAVFIPFSFNPFSMLSAPGLSLSLSSNTRSNTDVSSPLSKATRWRNDVSKLISPRIAASVIAETSGLALIKSAISSTHSILIKVESISVTSNLTSLGSNCSGIILMSKSYR